MTPLLIISPMFPPMEGGLPDHTHRLAESLHGHFRVTVLTSPGVETDREFAVLPTVRQWRDSRALLAQIEAAVPEGPLLWQYVPHMYGRGGVNLALPRVMGSLHARHRTQVVIAHEIAAPFSWSPLRSTYALAHRWMWRGVVRSADALGISTDGWLETLRRTLSRPQRLFLAPSPANLPVIAVTQDHRTKWLSDHDLKDAEVVLGFFGSAGAGKQFDWVLASWRDARRVQPRTALAVIGARPVADISADESRWFRPLGYLGVREASQALQALDVLLLPFLDGVSERRSSFMAGLAHAVPIVATLGPATGATLRRGVGDYFVGTRIDVREFSAAVTSLAFDATNRRRMAARARTHYETTFDWPRLAETLTQRLEGG